MRKSLKIHYTKEYFEKRDHLDIHLAHAIASLARAHGFKKILDVGCGTGKLVRFLNKKGFQTVGCDNADSALAFARKINKKKSIIKASAVKLPFKTSSFDLILAVSMIEHLTKTEAKKFLKDALRFLVPGGYIFMVTPNYATPIRYFQGKKWFGYSDPTHINFYTPSRLSSELMSLGFDNTKLQFKTIYNPPYLWEFPGILGKLPKFAKSILTYLLISTPLSFVRNSFWIAARKNKKLKKIPYFHFQLIQY